MEVFARVSNNAARYKLEMPPVAPGAIPEVREDGPCLLKAIINDYYTNTTSNTPIARRNLAKLTKHMKSIESSNVEVFNRYVQENMLELEAAAESTSDLLVNLFDGYMEAKDKHFRN